MAAQKPLLVLAAVLLLLTGCHRSSAPETKGIEELQGLPDILAETAKPGSPWLAFKLRGFQVNHVRGGAGDKPDGDAWANYRAKVTLWDESQDVAIAELFFRDAKQLDANSARQNPRPELANDPNDSSAQDPNKRGRTYRLHFPVETLDSILNTLRFSNTDVYLFYYERQWSVGSNSAEKIGSN